MLNEFTSESTNKQNEIQASMSGTALPAQPQKMISSLADLEH